MRLGRHFAGGIAPLLIGFLLVAVTATSAISLSASQQAALRLVRHTLEVEGSLATIRNLATDVETGQRGYLLTGHAAYLVPYQDAVRRLPAALDRLRRLTRDNPAHQADIARLRPMIDAKLAELARTIALTETGRREAALAVVREGGGRRQMSAITATIDRMVRGEERLLAERSHRERRAAALIRVVRIASAVLFVLLMIYSLAEGRRRLRQVEAANRRLREEMAEKSQAQGQVRQLQKMEAVGQLTGGIAHDFNNMLAIVIGSLDMARRRLTGAEHPSLARSIDSAAEGAQRAATLTARLLAFSRQQPLEPKVLDANKLVAGMSEMLRRTLGEPIEVQTVLAGGLWRVMADQAQIESALVNLAVNSRDAMPSGGKLTIETANAELDDRYAAGHEDVAAGQYVMLAVTDTGTGMAPGVIERAFDPFYSTKGTGRGTGLGLSQVFGFVKQSGGHVKIYSEVGRGTTVKLYLPRYSGPQAEAAEPAPDPAAAPTGRAEEVILVVEDEAQVRRTSVEALRDLGYTVIEAEDGARAIERIAADPAITLLFTDVVMPGMTGREVADRAVAMRPGLKVLYTTGYTRNAIVHNGVVDYGVAFIAKPFSIDALARKVREVLDRG